MPASALQYFKDDIARADAIRAHADSLPTGSGVEHLLRSDLLRSSWMFTIGALDAYFCDAYSILSPPPSAALAVRPGLKASVLHAY